MRILFLACLSPKTGNCTTAERIRDHIESAGHVCVLRDTREFSSASEITLLMSQDQEPFDAALAIHLFKGGRLLLDVGVPFGVVFGGTDINEDVKDEHKRSVMEEVLHRARFAVAFTEEMKQKAETYLDCDIAEVHVQAQGIETRPSSDFSWTDFLHTSVRSAGLVSAERSRIYRNTRTNIFLHVRYTWRDVHVPQFLIVSVLLRFIKINTVTTGVRVDRVDDLHVFLLVCGLRKVKDPLYLLKAFSEWHTQNPLVILIIIGPKIDPVLSSEVEECVKRSAGVFLAAERSQEELHAAMRKSFAVVNSSVSEGMSAAILEAMDLSVPVLARDIPGNAAVVRHEHSGLLYSSPEEFVLVSKRLLRDEELQENLRKNGKRYVTERHDAAKERTTYRHLVEKLQ